ncbi:MAG: DUF805 domain-containing protein [Sphingobacteriales bacterium]|nr:MAG: DUF805 domain-containing protein [Sphingobacteriales bacterium]
MIGYFRRAMQNYANFNGRDTRPQFWWFYLSIFIISFIAGFIAGLIQVQLLSTIVSLVFLIPNLAAAVRRVHDVGKSGWFILIPIYNIILLATEGENVDNEYGPNPRRTENSKFDFENQQFQQ